MSETNQTPKQAKKKDGLYVFIILLLILGLGGLGLFVASKNKQLNACAEAKAMLESDMAGMNEMMGQYVDDERGNIKDNLQSMLQLYDQQLSKNNANQDSIQAQKDKIKHLLEEMEHNKKASAYQIYKYRKETETLRRIMKGYIKTIDSLNTMNQGLRSDLDSTGRALTSVTSERNALQDRTSQLQEKVAAGARLNAFNILSVGMKYRLNNTLRETDRANKIEKIRSCFTIGENAIATAGSKNIYLQVITPKGKVLYHRSSNIINVNGANILYSDKKQIDYQNQSIDVCVYYDTNGATLSEGNYIVKVYADGALIGKDSFTLK